VTIEKASYFYSLEAGPMNVFWDDKSTWYITFDQTAKGRETIKYSGMCANFDGDPYSKQDSEASRLWMKLDC